MIIFYNILRSILKNKIKGCINIIEYRSKDYDLIKLEDEILIQYILDIKDREFLFKLNSIENIANFILETQNTKKIEKLWTY